MTGSVLVVEDDRGIRVLLESLLELEGYRVFTAEHGGPALARLRASSERLVVLLGLLMPVVDGLQVLESLAADPALALRHRVILVTAAAGVITQGRLAELRQQLDVPLIAKPFDLDVVLDTVRQAAHELGAS
jgi:CheY-like chemotaxis protein